MGLDHKNDLVAEVKPSSWYGSLRRVSSFGVEIDIREQMLRRWDRIR